MTNRLLLEAASARSFSQLRRQAGPRQNPTRNSSGVVEQCTARLRQQRRHPGPDLPVAELRELSGLASTWRALGVVRHRRAQHEVRLPGSVPRRQPATSATTRTSSTASTTACRTSSREPQSRSAFKQRIRYEAFYAQEQWTLGRLTLQGALRYDHAWSYFPEQQVGPVQLPADRRRLPRDRRASSATTTSRRAWASPTTCSATEDVAQGELRQVSRGGADTRPSAYPARAGRAARAARHHRR